MRRALLARILILACALVAPGVAAAQSYPAKPVSMVIPFPAGGAVDIVCRRSAWPRSGSSR
jgi:tripartite-type tricarboxylate transporter receptor subunit TctC